MANLLDSNANYFMKLGSVVTKGDPRECYKTIKRVGQG